MGPILTSAEPLELMGRQKREREREKERERELIQQRRVSTWKDWATGQGGEEYERLDLPLIAYHLHEWWSVEILAGASVNNIPQDILDRVKEEIVQLLEVSCLIEPHKEPSIVRRVSVRGRGEVAVFDPIQTSTLG
jgi:hypothetical protein